MKGFVEDIELNYDKKPIIVINTEAQCDEVIKAINDNKWKFMVGVEDQTLTEIRSWDYGILLVTNDESRGTDTRFMKDSIVLIISNVNNYN